MLNHETQGSLLDSVARAELTEVVKCTVQLLLSLVVSFGERLLEPGVLQSLNSCQSILGITLKHLLDEVLGTVRNLVPGSFFDAVLPS